MTAKASRKRKPRVDAELSKAYELIMRLAPASLPPPVYHESLEQPYPYPLVQTMTTYGALDESS
jgi:hypothetical protein